jgi:hypothetical protein
MKQPTKKVRSQPLDIVNNPWAAYLWWKTDWKNKELYQWIISNKKIAIQGESEITNTSGKE